MPLFKFIERRYLASFFQRGELCLSTIHSFKDTLAHGDARGDQNEGRHEISRRVTHLDLRPDVHEPVVSDIFKGSGSVTNLTFVTPMSSPDAFIFCSCKEYSDELFTAWYAAEGLDACYEIVVAQAFFHWVSRRIRSSAYFVGHADVVYRAAHIDYLSASAGLSPALTKLRSKYGWQVEHRAIWQPLEPSPPLKRWIVDVPAARDFARPFAFLENGRVRRVA